MNTDLLKKRRKAHYQVLRRMVELSAKISTFLIIFASLLTMSNWSAYSKILQDMIDPEAMQPYMGAQLLDEEYQRAFANKMQLLEQNLQEGRTSLEEVEVLLSSEELGALYPDEMRLEIPKVFPGTIPIKSVEFENFDFSNLYDSENAIQEALREGVVHYPYTADPDQYGNVFITGHSSNTPWDPGRYKDIFALLHKLEIGDQYSIYFKGKKFVYEVTEEFEIQPDEVWVLKQPDDQHISTLMTCTPVGTTLRRLIIRAKLVEVL